jgi:hypothetical protein
MELRLQRIYHTDEATLGTLFIDGLFECFILEDQPQPGEKIWGETRIPAGEYPIHLRTAGGMHARYGRRYTWHRGMLWLRNVPGFQFIYLHPGNNDDDSAGCLLPGATACSDPMEVHRSVAAYRTIYQKIAPVIGREPVTLEVVDEVEQRAAA